MSAELIPNRLLFDFEFPLRYRVNPPVIDGSLRGWTDAELLPPLSLLDGTAPFAPVWACWNETGLFVACQVTGKRQPLRCDPKLFWKSDNLRICTDMRDTRQNKRATRFCQQFYILPTGGGKKGDQAVAGSARIHRAREDAPLFTSEAYSRHAGRGEATRSAQTETTPEPRPSGAANVQSSDIQFARQAASTTPGGPDRIKVASSPSASSYNLEVHIPRTCLSGFDPVEHPRIGFYYILEDRDLGRQYLTVGDDLNWHIDPSTWATAVLTPN